MRQNLANSGKTLALVTRDWLRVLPSPMGEIAMTSPKRGLRLLFVGLPRFHIIILRLQKWWVRVAVLRVYGEQPAQRDLGAIAPILASDTHHVPRSSPIPVNTISIRWSRAIPSTRPGTHKLSSPIIVSAPGDCLNKKKSPFLIGVPSLDPILYKLLPTAWHGWKRTRLSMLPSSARLPALAGQSLGPTSSPAGRFLKSPQTAPDVPELVRACRCRLVAVGVEGGGRLEAEAIWLRLLARRKASSAPAPMWPAAQAASMVS